jgi:hypothetical protein
MLSPAEPGRPELDTEPLQAVAGEIDAEILYPLSQVVADIEQALQRKSFQDQIAEKLASDPA